MHLSDHDLRQLDEAALAKLTPEQARALLSKALEDLKSARERLAQNPTNSSRPPSTRAPWEQAEAQEREPEEAAVAAAQSAEEVKPEAASESASASEQKAAAPSPEGKGAEKPARRAGRRQGAPGHSRTQQLPVDAEQPHAPHGCAICGRPLDASHQSRPHNAHYVLELVSPADGGRGLVVQQTKHIYVETLCLCGHWSRALPGRCDDEASWSVKLSECHLAGPMLVAFICALTQRMRLSRAKVREFLSDWLGLSLSTALINQCVHEAARALEPVVEQEILATVRNVELAYADETSWKEHGKLLWLWVFTCATATLFIVGRRTREMVQRVLGEGFRGWLMSDGYWAYRELDQRLRCLPHIIRKARALEEGFEAEGRALGRHVLDVIAAVMQAVYDARGAPAQGGLRKRHAPRLQALLEHCLRLADCPHAKTRALARELLNDWDTFWVVLDHPELPLSNNEAERALRHWVIARRIGMGTRTPQGTRAFALLASVIETCRKRGVSPWPYLAVVIRQRRKGLPAPPMPAPVAAV
jgi:transposase